MLLKEALDDTDIKETKALGDDNPETLQYTVWFLLTLHMGMRGRDEHYKVLYGDLEIKNTTDGTKFVEFSERDTKTRNGESSNSHPFRPKMWSTPENIDRCPVRTFEPYVSKRPPQMCEPQSPFYLSVL